MYNSEEKRKVLIAFDNMIADMISNKKRNWVVTELFIRGRRLNISLICITQSYFKTPKDIRLHSTYHFMMKIQNKRELQQTAIYYSSNIDFKDYIKICKHCTAERYSF